MKKIILIIMAVLLAGCRKESGILQKDSVMQRKDPVTVWVNYTENEKMFSEGSAISNEGSLPGFVIKSRGELEEFYMNFRDILTLDYNGGEADFAAIMNDYDDSFFRDNYLVMVYNIASSGSFRYSFDKAEISDRKLTLRIKQINDPEVYTCDMSGWLTLVPFTREQLKDVDTYDFGMTVTEETVFTNFCYDTVVQLPGHIAWGEFSFEEDKNDVRDRGWTVITEGFINNEPDVGTIPWNKAQEELTEEYVLSQTFRDESADIWKIRFFNNENGDGAETLVYIDGNGVTRLIVKKPAV